MLRIIKRKETDPYFNLAAEEYILKEAAVDTFMTWHNGPSIIIGKHQNAAREINHQVVKAKGLPVIRRISGGGTVYHDPGNLNFSFIFINRKDNLINFEEFTEPVILFLKSLGLKASFQGKNNIVVDGLKVSGNSAHIYKNKVLHHGTLLFDSDLKVLDDAIMAKEDQYEDRSVRSVRASVANISNLLPDLISREEFEEMFRHFILDHFGEAVTERLSAEDIKAIQALADERYKSYAWNFGYSPDYEFHEKWYFQDDDYSVKIIVKNGIIQKSEIHGPGKQKDLLDNIGILLTGIPHQKEAIDQLFNQLKSISKNAPPILNQFPDHLF